MFGNLASVENVTENKQKCNKITVFCDMGDKISMIKYRIIHFVIFNFIYNSNWVQ
jgi:hypothetical protein